MTFQHVEFNFGHKEFKYAPVNYNCGENSKSSLSSLVVKSFNSDAVLSNEKRVVLPKYVSYNSSDKKQTLNSKVLGGTF